MFFNALRPKFEFDWLWLILSLKPNNQTGSSTTVFEHSGREILHPPHFSSISYENFLDLKCTKDYELRWILWTTRSFVPYLKIFKIRVRIHRLIPFPFIKTHGAQFTSYVFKYFGFIWKNNLSMTWLKWESPNVVMWLFTYFVQGFDHTTN